MEKQRRALIEDLGVHLEHDNLTPLAARIFATLILTGKEGITFDQLVTDLNASKSSISSHLDHLQTSGKVKYFTKTGDRKRYFIVNPDLMSNVINEQTDKWEKELQLHQRVLKYKEDYNKANKNSEHNFDLEFQRNLLTFLEEAKVALQRFKAKIQSKHLTNYNS